ncbi:hypothetical protein B0H19DRAFT_447343 [Mycena capillaripes]|nr:hypothetical protein B0H19DRAFT_447343 [Mycena capillaripes]
MLYRPRFLFMITQLGMLPLPQLSPIGQKTKSARLILPHRSATKYNYAIKFEGAKLLGPVLCSLSNLSNPAQLFLERAPGKRLELGRYR